MPSHLRNIPPCDSLGGFAGGSKFVYDKILFKFAKDTGYGFYGGDELLAAKAAGTTSITKINLWARP